MDDQKLSIRDVVRAETKKCMEDPIYFMRKYVKIQHPNKGTIPFNLFPFQEDTLNSFSHNRFILILKSRQLGITTLVAAYSLWLSIFNSDKSILIISIKQEVSKEIVTKVRFANEKLPSWLKVKEITNNHMSLRFSNGSQVSATSSAKDAGRSKSLSLLIVDEAAFIDEAQDIWTSAYNTLSTGGGAIILSTPNGVGNWFHKLWVDGERKKNDFTLIKLPWHLHPERDKKWREEQTKQLGVRGANQECDCDFLTSGVSVIDLTTIKWYEDNHQMVKQRKEARRGESLWIFEYPQSGKDYFVCADVARGDGSDYSAFHIFDMETLDQVVEFQDKVDTKEFGDILVNLSTEYNDALLVVERENVGWSVLQQIIDRQYKNTFYSNTNDPKIADVYHHVSNRYNHEEAKLLPGFSTTGKTRPLLISKIEEYFREKLVSIHSSRLTSELKTFVWSNGKAQAAENYNDDLVMALGIGLWVRDTALRLRGDRIGLAKTMLDKIHISQTDNKTPIYTGKSMSTGQSQWQMKIGNKPNDTESLMWLLR